MGGADLIIGHLVQGLVAAVSDGECGDVTAPSLDLGDFPVEGKTRNTKSAMLKFKAMF